MKSRLPFCLMALICLACASTAGAANWPAWRGPTGDGVCPETNLPIQWNRTNNVRWKMALPDRGNSTPIIWENKIFITQAIEKEGKRLVICFDRNTGKKIWENGTTYTEKETTHETNPHCSASPVTDGEVVIASFGSAGLFCFSLEGKELWRRDLGKQAHIWGNGASPIIHGNLCILNFGPGERTFLIAVNKKTGETVWQHDEPGGAFGHDSKTWIGSWSTPLVIRSLPEDELTRRRGERGGERKEGAARDGGGAPHPANGQAGARTEMALSYPNRVVAFDPASGRELWSCKGLNPLAYTSPLYSEGIIVAMGGFSGSALAVRAGGSGDVTETHRLWLHPRSKQRIGSGVIHDGHIYILNDPGVAECFELRTGKLVWEERLEGPSKKYPSWGSMVLSGDKIYVVNQAGDGFVLRASPKFEVISANPLEERTLSSVAVSDGEIAIRTYQHLWLISERKGQL